MKPQRQGNCIFRAHQRVIYNETECCRKGMTLQPSEKQSDHTFGALTNPFKSVAGDSGAKEGCME